VLVMRGFHRFLAGFAKNYKCLWFRSGLPLEYFFEKPPSEGKPASPGWYNSAAFEKEAIKQDFTPTVFTVMGFFHEIKKLHLWTLYSSLILGTDRILRYLIVLAFSR